MVPQTLVPGCNNSKTVNNSSFAVIVTISGSICKQKLLFGGDMETSGWEALLKFNAQFRAAVAGTTLYFPSHHGHSSGFSSALFNAMGAKPFMNLISVTEGDDSVDGNYSNNAQGIYFGAEPRFTLTTRTHGSIFIDTNPTGNGLITHKQLPDNIEPGPGFPQHIAEYLKALGLPSTISAPPGYPKFKL